MNKIEYLSNKIDTFFKENPAQFGWVFIVLGIVFFIGAIKRWSWVY